MKLTFLIFISLLAITSFSQKNDVEILAEKGNGTIIFIGKNNSNTTQEVTLKLEKLKGLTGYSKPITRKVPAQGRLTFVRLRSKSGKYSYSSSYVYKPAPTAIEKAAIAAALRKKTLKNIGDIDKGIVIFNKTGCTRCSYTTSYLTDNNIDFKVINVDIKTHKENNALMWQTLRENGVLSTNILTPIILVDGKLVNSQGDIKEFVKTLD
ncbi:MAG: glutaredoxin [Bacteroidia bacterium]|nr:glutaredoxin [Bacteroidia bacterium]